MMKHDLPAGPGAGMYGLPSMLTTKKEFNRAHTTSNFHKPIAKARDGMSKLPAPNSYDVCNPDKSSIENIQFALFL